MPRRALGPFLGSALCAAALAPLAFFAYTVPATSRLDASLFEHLAGEEESFVFGLAETFAQLGDLGPLLVLGALIFALGVSWRRSREAVAALVVIAGANVTTQLLKHLLARPRLQLDFGFHKPWADAFPSGHTTAVASLAAALILVTPPPMRVRAILVGGFIAGVVGVSLVVNEWHYPSDVLGGYLVVASWALAAVGVLRLSDSRRRSTRPAAERHPTGELRAAAE